MGTSEDGEKSCPRDGMLRACKEEGVPERGTPSVFSEESLSRKGSTFQGLK